MQTSRVIRLAISRLRTIAEQHEQMLEQRTEPLQAARVHARRRLVFLVSVVVGVVALSGCGTGTDRAQVRAATARFFSALDAHHGAAACMQLSPALRKTVAREQSARGCADAVGKIEARRSPVAVVQVYATSARVDLASGESVFLSAMRDGWRIDALGCRPRSSGPFECEEQS